MAALTSLLCKFGYVFHDAQVFCVRVYWWVVSLLGCAISWSIVRGFHVAMYGVYLRSKYVVLSVFGGGVRVCILE